MRAQLSEMERVHRAELVALHNDLRKVREEWRELRMATGLRFDRLEDQIVDCGGHRKLVQLDMRINEMVAQIDRVRAEQFEQEERVTK